MSTQERQVHVLYFVIPELCRYEKAGSFWPMKYRFGSRDMKLYPLPHNLLAIIRLVSGDDVQSTDDWLDGVRLILS